MTQLMAIVNLTPDSFFGPSRATAADALERIRRFAAAGATIVDLGAVSTRPGAASVSARAEWRRLSPVLRQLAATFVIPGSDRESHRFQISIDTTRAEIVRKAFKVIGPFIVNDISAGEDDPEMLPTVAELGLPFIAMHKRGNPQTMNGLCDYPDGVIAELLRYFDDFAVKADSLGIHAWILDPGLGFAKTNAQCWEILERLEELKVFGKPILIGAADKRFTKEIPEHIAAWYATSGYHASLAGSESAIIAPKSPISAASGSKLAISAPETTFSATNGSESASTAPDGTNVANALAIAHGADILRVHRIP